MEERNTIDKKIDLLKSIEYSNDYEMISSIFLEWQKKKPTETLDKMIEAFNRMYFFTFNMEESVRYMRKIVSEYRADKIRAVERARKADKRIEELEEKLKLKL